MEYFKDLVLDIRNRIPKAAIGVDVLVGFPGETDTMFQNTCHLIQALPIAYLHVFRFSPRKGTPAATFADQVPPHEIKARSKSLIEIGNDLKSAFYKNMLNQSVEVLVESVKTREPGILKGRTRNYVPVFFKGNAHRVNTFVTCRIDTLDRNGTLLGTAKDTLA